MSEKISLYNLYKENTLKLLKTMDLSSQLNLLLSLDTKITIVDFTCLFPIKYNYYTVNTKISVYLVYNPKLLKKELFSSSDFIIFLVDNFLVKEVLEFLDEKCLINFIEFI